MKIADETEDTALEPRSADDLREQAARCRRLASSALDRRTIDALSAMASEYEDEASRLGE